MPDSGVTSPSVVRSAQAPREGSAAHPKDWEGDPNACRKSSWVRGPRVTHRSLSLKESLLSYPAWGLHASLLGPPPP